MEHFEISQIDGNFHIDGFPDAVAIVALTGGKAQRLADLMLHKHDLDIAKSCLDLLPSIPDDSMVIQDALWRSAITHYIKCFGDGSRFQLSANKIYRNESPLAIQSFNYFKTLRNKHIVHDQNSYGQASPGAIISNSSKEYKIEKIVCPVMVIFTLDQAPYENLNLLVKGALAWVIAEFDSRCEALTAELELLDRNELLSMPTLVVTAPGPDEVGTPRKPV